MSDNRLEAIVVKYTLGAAFAVATLLFVGKVLGLVILYIKSGKLWEDLKGEMFLHR